MESEDDKVRRRAYLIWEEAGRPWGLEQEHWERARREVAEAAAAVPPIRVAEPQRPGRPASGNGTTTTKLSSVKPAKGRSSGPDRKSP